MVTYVFPGQGSQTRGMGGSLFNEFPEIVQKANNILGYSIEELCLTNPNDRLDQTEYTQPAVYVVNTLHYMKRIKDGHKPTFVAGHSLGEYNALYAADVFDFETGLRLVQKRGELMSQATGGGMAVIIGLRGDEVRRLLEQQGLTNVTVANYNSYSQIVISGPADEVNATQLLFEKIGATLFIPLKVSGAFHSPHMTAASRQFAEFLKGFSFAPPSIPVIANIDAKPYQANDIQAYLTRQINNSVQWIKVIECLLKEGESEFCEIGEGTVLTGLINRIRNGK